MPPIGRLVLGLMAVFVAWTMVRAVRSGTAFSEGSGYSLDERPMMFTLAMIVHGVIIAYFLWLAAGYDAAGFVRLLGLDWIAPTAP